MYDILQLNEMKVTELRDIAVNLDIPKHKNLNKQELVYKILDFQALNPQSVKEATAILSGGTNGQESKPAPRKESDSRPKPNRDKARRPRKPRPDANADASEENITECESLSAFSPSGESEDDAYLLSGKR